MAKKEWSSEFGTIYGMVEFTSGGNMVSVTLPTDITIETVEMRYIATDGNEANWFEAGADHEGNEGKYTAGWFNKAAGTSLDIRVNTDADPIELERWTPKLTNPGGA